MRWDDGTVHVVHATGRVRRGADGSPQAVVGVLQDVTDQDIARGDSYAAKIDAVTDAARPLPLGD